MSFNLKFAFSSLHIQASEPLKGPESLAVSIRKTLEKIPSEKSLQGYLSKDIQSPHEWAQKIETILLKLTPPLQKGFASKRQRVDICGVLLNELLAIFFSA